MFLTVRLFLLMAGVQWFCAWDSLPLDSWDNSIDLTPIYEHLAGVMMCG